ncbi:MAG: hypothetical protein Q4G27_01595 [Flavobacteriaceae bacterium]|nr:hypothetical protein [Flavobacteriaceae bacterium]
MKKILFCLFSLTLVLSCSSDDNNNGGSTADNRDYFPNSNSAQWNFNYSINNQGSSSSGTSIMNMGLDQNIGGSSYQVLSNTAEVIGALDEVPFQKNSQNEVIIRPLASGFSYVDFLPTGSLFDNLNFIKNAMSSNEVLSESTQEFVGEPMEIPDANINGTVTPRTFITISTQHVGKSNSLAVNNNSYQNIIQNRVLFKIKVVLDIDANANMGGQVMNITRSHELVSPQQYGTLDLWLAENTGIIKSDYLYSFNNVNMNTQINIAGININLLDLAPDLANFNSSLHLTGNASLTSFSL